MDIYHKNMRIKRAETFNSGGDEPIAAGILQASLSAIRIRKDGERTDFGVVGRHSVTDAFVAALVDYLQEDIGAGIGGAIRYRYHRSGVGITAENANQTALITAAEAGPATGSQEEGATANIYKSVATITYTGAHTDPNPGIIEHGIFSSYAETVLMDRTLLGAEIDVEIGDSIQFTYQLTFTAGS